MSRPIQLIPYNAPLTPAEQDTLGLEFAMETVGMFLRGAPEAGFPTGEETGNGQLQPASIPVNTNDGNTDEPTGLIAKGGNSESIHNSGGSPTNTTRPPVLPPYIAVYWYKHKAV